MSVEYGLKLVYGIIITENDSSSLERLLKDYPHGLTTPKEQLKWGLGERFFELWTRLSFTCNSNFWITGGLTDSLVVHTKSNAISLMDEMDSDEEHMFPIALSQLRTPPAEELAQLIGFRNHYGLSNEPDHVIVARVS